MDPHEPGGFDLVHRADESELPRTFAWVLPPQPKKKGCGKMWPMMDRTWGGQVPFKFLEPPKRKKNHQNCQLIMRRLSIKRTKFPLRSSTSPLPNNVGPGAKYSASLAYPYIWGKWHSPSEGGCKHSGGKLEPWSAPPWGMEVGTGKKRQTAMKMMMVKKIQPKEKRNSEDRKFKVNRLQGVLNSRWR